MTHPEQIGKYEIREYLGGGMSHVYKAWDPVMNRTVAVKVLTPEATADPESKARFLREAQTAGGLQHDNVIRVYDFGEEQGRPYMVMEFLEGEDLRGAIASGNAGDLRNRLRLALEASKALEYIHSQSIVHRDIKPENLHLDKYGRVRLMDFGIAKRPDMNLTRAGFTLGTPYYMSPEQVRGQDVTHLADIYSFGILLYEILAGAKPITGDTIEQVFYKIMNEPLDMTSLRAANAPEDICRLVERMTAKDPAARVQSFTEVRASLERAVTPAAAPAPSPEPASEIPSPVPRESRKPLWLALGGLAVVIVAVVAVLLFRGEEAEPPAPIPVTQTTTAPEPVLSTPTGEMLLVPEGEFLFGPDGEQRSLPTFYMDKTEVTNSAYAEFCRDENHNLPPDFPADKAEYPVVNVTVEDARAFARWAGKRLPTAEEWEKAARGTDGRLYPWGNEHDPSRANVRDASGREPELLPASALPGGASPYGILQMAGNVWELIGERVQPSPQAVKTFSFLDPPATATEDWYTMRGGPYDDPLVSNVGYEWGSVPGRFSAPNLGFRCVRDAD